MTSVLYSTIERIGSECPVSRAFQTTRRIQSSRSRRGPRACHCRPPLVSRRRHSFFFGRSTSSTLWKQWHCQPNHSIPFCKLCWEALQDFVLCMLLVLGIISIVVETTIGLPEGEPCGTCWLEGAAILASVGIVVLGDGGH